MPAFRLSNLAETSLGLQSVFLDKVCFKKRSFQINKAANIQKTFFGLLYPAQHDSK